MMVNSDSSPNESLPGILAERARAASDGRLIFDVAVGMLVGLAVAIWHPRTWALPLSMAVCLVAYGVWGLIDREVAERTMDIDGRIGQILRVLRGAAAVAGLFSAAAGCLIILGMALGTWQS